MPQADSTASPAVVRALGSSARPAGCVVGGHEGEDNVLRDDDLALFLTINAVGFGAVPMIPSLPRLWWIYGDDSRFWV